MNDKVLEIYSILAQWNISPNQIVIDKEAEDLLLIALKQNPTAVYLDGEDGLIIEQD
jgi:hypothetical protein